MFLCSIFIAFTLLKYGESQSPCVSEIRSLKNDLQVELRDIVRITLTTTDRSVSRVEVQNLLEDKATKDEILALNHSVAAANQLITNLLRSNQELEEMLDGKATREDVRLRVSESVSVLNETVNVGNQLILDALVVTKSQVEANHAVLQQCVMRGDEMNRLNSEDYVTREEVHSIIRSEIQTVVRSEIQSLVSYINEVQQNNTAKLLDAFLPGSPQNPATSCKNIPPGSPSGIYWIQADSSPARQQYCDMSRSCCNSTGGWMRVANLDVGDPNEQCPSGFELVTNPVRACSRNGDAVGCTTVVFPVHGVEYSRVCGRIIAYQYSHMDAFWSYKFGGETTIDHAYVDGVSLTHGKSPRNHIWTFAAAIDEIRSDANVCPCTRANHTYTGTVPPFIEEDYFCETASRSLVDLDRFYSQDPLWDGEGCGEESSCCSFNGPPWFCKDLSQTTTDDVEMRVCSNSLASEEDTPLEVVEIYVQ